MATLFTSGSKRAGGPEFKMDNSMKVSVGSFFLMKKIKEEEIKKIEDIFRQIVEEKPHYLMPFKEKKFHFDAERILNKKIEFDYVKNWLAGRRRRA